MPHFKIAIPDALKTILSRFPKVDWARVARQAIEDKARALSQAQSLLSRSKLTERDAIKIGRQVKRRVLARHR